MEPAFNGAATRRGQMLLDHLRFYVTRFCSASLSLSLSLAQRPPPLCQRLDLHVSCVANTFLHPAQCVRLGVFFCFFFFGGCFPGPAFESSRHRPTFTAVFYYFAVGVEDRDRQTERERERETKVKELDLTGGGYQPARRLLRPRRKTQRNGRNPRRKKPQKNSTLYTHTHTHKHGTQTKQTQRPTTALPLADRRDQAQRYVDGFTVAAPTEGRLPAAAAAPAAAPAAAAAAASAADDYLPIVGGRNSPLRLSLGDAST